MSRREFERVVAAALDSIPARLISALDNVAVVVEDEPTEDELLEEGLDPDEETLFGIYQGVALTERDASYGATLPDRIVIFRKPLLEACSTRTELVREIHDTVVHELGHHFGLDEDDLP